MLSFNWGNTSIQIGTLNMVFGSALDGLHLIYFIFLIGLVLGVSTVPWVKKVKNQSNKKIWHIKHPRGLKGWEGFADTEILETSRLEVKSSIWLFLGNLHQHSYCCTKSSVDLTLQSSCSAAVRSRLFLPKSSYSSVGAYFDRRQGPNSEFLLAALWNKWDIHTSPLFLDLWKQVEISYSCHTSQGFCAVRRPC